LFVFVFVLVIDNDIDGIYGAFFVLIYFIHCFIIVNLQVIIVKADGIFLFELNANFFVQLIQNEQIKFKENEE